MATVKFTPHLKRFFPDLEEITIEANTVAEVVSATNNRWEGIADYVVDEQGALRKHVNIFVDGELIHDKQQLSDTVTSDSRIFIMQALSGG
ncbi:MAG: MoaD/ThiS family protein [Chloroflexota bacterium]